MRELWELFGCFFKLGCITFGGGMAMLPGLQYEVVEKRGWATREEVLDYYSVGQCTPGIIAVNVSTFIGYKRKGILGGFLATLAFVLPSLVVILVIAAFLQNFAQYKLVQHAFAGVRVAVAAMVVGTVARMWKAGVKSVLGVLLFAAAFVLIALFDIPTVYVVIAAIALGIVCTLVKGRTSGGGADK